MMMTFDDMVERRQQNELDEYLNGLDVELEEMDLTLEELEELERQFDEEYFDDDFV